MVNMVKALLAELWLERNERNFSRQEKGLDWHIGHVKEEHSSLVSFE